ncbi:hypothetical protein D3C85_611740 [compost metagenome]
MKYLAAIALVLFATTSFAAENPFANGDETSQHQITENNCKMLEAIGRSAVDAKSRGVIESTVIATLIKPMHMESPAFRAFFPEVVTMVHEIYEMDGDAYPISDAHYADCEKSVGRFLVYYN